MKVVIPKGATSRILTVFIQDSSSTTGAGLGSLDQTSSIVGGYVREGGTGVALAVDENVTTEGTYQAPSAAGKVRIGTPANMRTGTYELHFHNDLWATGAETTTITLGGASNMAPLLIEVQLSDPVRGLGAPTALPNAAAEAAGGLYTRGTGAGQINQSANGQIDVNAERLNNVAQSLLDLKDFADDGYDPSTNKVSGVVLVDTATNLTNAPTNGDLTATMKSSVGTAVAASAVASVTGNVGGNVAGSVGSVTGAVGSVTGNVGGNVSGSVGSVTAGVTLADDAITASKYDESTAFPLTSADSSSTRVARTGADSDTLETISDEIAVLSIPTPTQIWQLANGIENGVTPQQALQRIGAVAAGEISGAGTGTEVFIGLDGSTTRVTVTVDGSGNRTSVVYA